MKKAISLIMAAAMAFGLTTAAFADIDVRDSSTGAVEPSATVKVDLTSSAPSDDYAVWTDGGIVDPGSQTRFDFAIEAYGNKLTADDGTQSNVALNRKYYEFDVKLTGPLEYDRLRLTHDTVNTPNEIHGSFYVEADGLSLTAPKEGTVTLVAKATAEGRRLGFESVTFDTLEYTIAYGETNIDKLLEEIDEMHEYGETELEFYLDSPVISKDMMEVLKKELNTKDTVIFLYGDLRFAVKGSDVKKATPIAFNIAYSTGEMSVVADAFADADFDADVSYLGFRSGAKLPMNATVTLDSAFSTPYVYQFDGSQFNLLTSTMDVDNGAVSFTVSALGNYVITEEPIPADLQVLPEEDEDNKDEGDKDESDKEDDEIIVDDDKENGQGSNNPNTGSSSVSMAVMMAAATLAAAGLLVTKKSK